VATAAGSPPTGSRVTGKDKAIVRLTLPEVPVTG
jgi:hypothetical protein